MTTQEKIQKLAEIEKQIRQLVNEAFVLLPDTNEWDDIPEGIENPSLKDMVDDAGQTLRHYIMVGAEKLEQIL